MSIYYTLIRNYASLMYSIISPEHQFSHLRNGHGVTVEMQLLSAREVLTAVLGTQQVNVATQIKRIYFNEH